MKSIPAAEAAALRAHLESRLAAPVMLALLTRASDRLGAAAEALCAELSVLSPRIAVRVRRADAGVASVERSPAVTLEGAARGRVRYIGLPSGYELAVLLADLVDVASGTTELLPSTRQALSELAHDVHIQVFVTATCPFCPAAARLAHQMAVEGRRVTADVIDAPQFPDLLQRHGVRHVPTTVVNDRFRLFGPPSEARLLAAVLEAAR
ncbi:MAG TPA: thioredoxin family protein [Vicinamibacteria bacterium]